MKNQQEKLTPDELAAIAESLRSRPAIAPRGRKYAKANSLRTQQAIAGFGKSARHPLCLAALGLWRMDAELSVRTKAVKEAGKFVSDIKQQRGRALALVNHFLKEEGKGVETQQAHTLLGKIDKHLRKAQQCYQAAIKFRSEYQGWREWAVARFSREHDAVIRAGDVKARRALQRIREQWRANANGARLNDGDYITLEILKMLRDKTFRAAWAKDGAVAGYWEIGRGRDRALSDEAWQGRLTAREIHSRLVNAEVLNGSRAKEREQLHEVRRIAGKLGIRLAEDQRGRKWKPYPAKQEPKGPRGRPRKRASVEPEFHADLAAVEAEQARESRTDPRLKAHQDFSRKAFGARMAVQAGIAREITRLSLLSGHSKSGPPAKRKPEGTIKGRSATFAAFVDAT